MNPPDLRPVTEAMVAVTIAIRDTVTPAIERLGRTMRVWSYRIRLAEARAALTRPDGRPRRTGHRHRGAWGRG